MKRIGVLACFLGLVAGGMVVGQSGADFAIEAVPSGTEIALGDSYTVTVRFTSDVAGIQAWSFGLCIDRTVQEVIRAVPGDDFNSLRFGGPPEWWSINADANGGVTQAVMLDLRAGTALGVVPDTDPLSVLEVDLRPTDKAADTTVVIPFCDTAGNPQVATLFSVGTSGYVPATKTASSVRVVRDPATLLSYTKATYTLATASSATVETVIKARCTFNLYGFSFGVAHDAALVTLQSVTIAPELVAALGNGDPEFVAFDLAPANGTGYTVGVVFQTSAPATGGDLKFIKSTVANPATPVVVAAYSATGGVEATTSLTFAGTLGEPPVAILYDIGKEVTPTARGCEIQVSTNPLEVLFKRGDANGDGNINISDAVTMLRYLFTQGTVPFDCVEALNCNGTGNVDIADVVYLLGYQFAGGLEPPAPFQACGTVPQSPTFLGCVTYPNCPQ